MSVVVWAARAPATAKRATDIGSNPPAVGRRSDVIARIGLLVPDVDWMSDEQGFVDRDEASLEIDLGHNDPVRYLRFVMHSSKRGPIAPVVAAIVEEFGLRAVDESGAFFDPAVE